jgi:alpha-amylase
MAVVMGNGNGGTNWMKVGRPYTKYTDITNAVSTTIVTNADGWGDFACQGGSVSGWVLV